MSENSPVELSSPAPEPRRFGKRLWITLALACLIFLAGGVTGFGVATLRIEHNWHNHPSPEQAAQRITDRMKDQLKLSDAQAVKIHGILTDSQHFFMQLRDQMQPTIRKEMGQVHDRINAVLTPAQQMKWKKMYEQMSHHWRWQEHHHWHHPIHQGKPFSPGARRPHPGSSMMPSAVTQPGK